MKVQEFIDELNSLSSELKDKDIEIECPNGLLVEPKIKLNFENKNAPSSNYLVGNTHVENKIISIVVDWE